MKCQQTFWWHFRTTSVPVCEASGVLSPQTLQAKMKMHVEGQQNKSIWIRKGIFWTLFKTRVGGSPWFETNPKNQSFPLMTKPEQSLFLRVVPRHYHWSDQSGYYYYILSVIGHYLGISANNKCYNHNLFSINFLFIHYFPYHNNGNMIIIMII